MKGTLFQKWREADAAVYEAQRKAWAAAEACFTGGQRVAYEHGGHEIVASVYSVGNDVLWLVGGKRGTYRLNASRVTRIVKDV